jgi:hypothetical protein
MNNSHTSPAAACGGLYYNGVTYFACELKRLDFICNDPFGAGRDRHIGLFRHFAGLNLVAEQPHRLDGRADKRYAAVFANLRKVYIFSQKAVTRMNRLDVGDFGGAYDAGDIQITFSRAGRTYADSLIGKLQVWGIFVSFRIDGDSLNAQLVAGTYDAQRYFTSISYKNF